MPISGLTLMENATSISVTGGTSIAFEEDGIEVKNGKHVADVAESDFTIRKNASFRNRAPSLNSDGTYTKGKRMITLVHPKKLADLSTTFNLVRIEVEAHPETTAAELLDLTNSGAQLLFDSDSADFLAVGSIA